MDNLNMQITRPITQPVNLAKKHEVQNASPKQGFSDSSPVFMQPFTFHDVKLTSLETIQKQKEILAKKQKAQNELDALLEGENLEFEEENSEESIQQQEKIPGLSELDPDLLKPDFEVKEENFEESYQDNKPQLLTVKLTDETTRRVPPSGKAGFVEIDVTPMIPTASIEKVLYDMKDHLTAEAKKVLDNGLVAQWDDKSCSDACMAMILLQKDQALGKLFLEEAAMTGENTDILGPNGEPGIRWAGETKVTFSSAGEQSNLDDLETFPVIATMGGHYIVIDSKTENNTYIVKDPYHGQVLEITRENLIALLTPSEKFIKVD